MSCPYPQANKFAARLKRRPDVKSKAKRNPRWRDKPAATKRIREKRAWPDVKETG